MSYSYQRLTTADTAQFGHLMTLFAKVFEDKESYQDNVPDEAYTQTFLANQSHIVLVAITETGEVVGGLVAYSLQKFEQQRSEIYIYDLAVDLEYQRQGIATALITKLKDIAKEHKAYVVFVQADRADTGAVAFYRSLCTDEILTHTFDIKIA